jgi:hypothetical protein
MGARAAVDVVAAPPPQEKCRKIEGLEITWTILRYFIES